MSVKSISFLPPAIAGTSMPSTPDLLGIASRIKPSLPTWMESLSAALFFCLNMLKSEGSEGQPQGGRTDGRTNERNVCPFYKTLSPAKAAAPLLRWSESKPWSWTNHISRSCLAGLPFVIARNINIIEANRRCAKTSILNEWNLFETRFEFCCAFRVPTPS